MPNPRLMRRLTATAAGPLPRLAGMVVSQGDVEWPARLRNQERIETNAPGTGVAGHCEERVAGNKAGARVILVTVVCVRCAAIAVAVGKGQGVKAHQTKILAHLGVHAGDDLILLEDRFGIILVQVSARVILRSSAGGLIGVARELLVWPERVQGAGR